MLQRQCGDHMLQLHPDDQHYHERNHGYPELSTGFCTMLRFLAQGRVFRVCSRDQERVGGERECTVWTPCGFSSLYHPCPVRAVICFLWIFLGSLVRIVSVLLRFVCAGAVFFSACFGFCGFSAALFEAISRSLCNATARHCS